MKKAERPERLGFFFFLLVLYLFFDYGRPSYPMGIPMLISALLFGGWLVSQDKKWSPQVACFFALVVLMLAGVPMAINSYSAFWTTYGMATVLLCTCVPMTSFITSARHIKAWMYSFVGVSVYVGGYAILHHGFGPSGAAGGQDENYVAAMMGMAISFAYFCIPAEKRSLGKVLLGLSILVFCAAIVVGYSRGGFLGLCIVVMYCLARASNRLVALGVVAVIALTVATVSQVYVNTTHTHTKSEGTPSSGSAYLTDMSTIGDVEDTGQLRLELWKIGLRMFGAYPIFGVGPGSFRWIGSEYQSDDQWAKYHRSLGGAMAHSLFVDCLAELGATGACLFLILLWYTFRDLREVRRLAKVSGQLDHLRLYSDAIAGSILACLVNGLFLSLFYYSYLWLFIALGVAIKRVATDQMTAMPRADAPVA